MRTTILLLLFVLSAAGLPAEDTLATLDRGTAYEMSWNPDHNRWVTEIYVSPKEACAKCTINARLQSIAAGSRTLPGLSSLFKVEATSVPTTFEISAAKDARLLPGTYQATLLLSNGKTKDAKSIQLTIPSGELAGPPSLEITRVLYSPFKMEEPELRIWETSGKTPVDVQVRQSEVFSGAEGQATGQIRIDAARIPPDASVRLKYNVDGDFPLGTAAAKIAVSSHQVQAPLVIPIQVRTRMSRWILLGILVFGLVLGFLMRTILKPRIETGQARKQAFELVKDLGKPGQPPDETYQKDIAVAQKVLLTALEARDATSATIKAAVDAADAARRTALNELTKRLQDTATAINAFDTVVQPAWKLPDAMQEDLAEARKSAERAKEFLKSSDAKRASDTIGAAATQFRNALRTKAADWRQNANDFIHDMEGVKNLIESGGRDRFETAFKTLSDDVAKVTVNADADPAALKAALEAIDRAQGECPAFVKGAGSDVEETFAAMDAVIGAITLDKESVWEEAREATADFTKQLNSLSIENYGQSGKLQPSPGRLRNIWHDALIAQWPGAKDTQEVETALAGGQYEEAAKAVEKALGVQAGGTSLNRAQPVIDLSSVSFSAGYIEGSQAAAAGAGRQPAEAPEVEAPPGLDALERRTLGQLLRDQALQNVLSFVALLVVGYLIFADKFVGTNGDLLAAFFWGFTTDIGVDALITAGKSKQAGG